MRRRDFLRKRPLNMNRPQKEDLARVLHRFPERKVKRYLCLYGSRAAEYDTAERIDWDSLTRLTVEFEGRFLRWSPAAGEHINANKIRVYAKSAHKSFLAKR